jgi:hypothetical protein
MSDLIYTNAFEIILAGLELYLMSLDKLSEILVTTLHIIYDIK